MKMKNAMKMKKIVWMLSLLAFVAAMPMSGKTKRRYITPEEVHVSVSPAAKQKAETLYESVRKDYAQNKISADGVVDKALYHGVWSPELEARCLQLVSDKSDRAKAELGHLYTFNKTAYLFPGKEAEGVRLMEASANAGNDKAKDYLGVYYSSKKDYRKAWQYFNSVGSQHIPYAMRVMGEMYEKGQGVKKDYAKSRDLYQKAALLGDALGAARYGRALQQVKFGTVDWPDAFVWTYVAGDLGNDVSRSNLRLPLRGERFGDDKNTAFIRNSLTLGEAFNDEVGHPIQNEPIYQEGYLKGLASRGAAAQKGDPWSLFYLGSMSYNNEFLNRKDALVSECYEPLLNAPSLPDSAMGLVYERMANIYGKGQGKENAAKANEYMRKAADLGNLAAYKIVENIPD